MENIALDETDVASHRSVERTGPAQIMLLCAALHSVKPDGIAEASVSGTRECAVASPDDACVIKTMLFEQVSDRGPSKADRTVNPSDPGPT
jgi:hypothetical protein